MFMGFRKGRNMSARYETIRCYLNDNMHIMLASFALAFLCYGIYLFPVYSIDSHIVFNNSVSTSIYSLFEGGRFVFASLLAFLYFIGISPTSNGFVLNFVGIALIAVCQYIFYKRIFPTDASKEVRTVCYLSSCIVFFNPFFADWFSFSETVPYYQLALMLAMFSSIVLFDEKYGFIKRLLCSLLLLVFSSGIYQPAFNYFVLFSLTFIYIDMFKYLGRKAPESKPPWKKTIYKVVTAFGVYLFVAVFQLVLSLTVIGAHGRVSFSVVQGLRAVLAIQLPLWRLSTVGIDSNLYLLLFLSTFVLFFIYVSRKLYLRIMRWDLPFIFLVFISAIYTTIFIIPTITEGWFAQRLTTMFPAVLSFLAICAVTTIFHYGDLEKFNLPAYIGALLAPLVFVFVVQTARLGIDTHKSNAQDALIIRSVNEKIIRHENENGVEVTNIAVKTNVDYVKWAYPGIFFMFDFNVRSAALPNRVPYMFTTWAGRNFETIDMPEEIYEEHFKGRHWNSFSNEQFIIIDNTLYMYLY